MNDLRKVKTKKLIQNALIELLKTKSIHCISITDICTTAQINRSTFYSHYEDYNIFVQQVMQETAVGLTMAVSDSHQKPNLLLEKGAAYDCYYKWFNHIRENREIFQLLLGPNGSTEFDDILREQGINWYTSMLQPLSYKFDLIVPLDILVNYVVSAHYGMLKFYLRSNLKYSASYMAEKMVYLTFNGIFAKFGFYE